MDGKPRRYQWGYRRSSSFRKANTEAMGRAVEAAGNEYHSTYWLSGFRAIPGSCQREHRLFTQTRITPASKCSKDSYGYQPFVYRGSRGRGLCLVGHYNLCNICVEKTKSICGGVPIPQHLAAPSTQKYSYQCQRHKD